MSGTRVKALKRSMGGSAWASASYLTPDNQKQLQGTQNNNPRSRFVSWRCAWRMVKRQGFAWKRAA